MNLLPWVLAACAGLLSFLGYVGYDLFYLEWVFLIPLFWATRTTGPGRAFVLGWVAGTIGHAGGFYWFVHMLTVFAGVPMPVAVLGLLVLAAFNGSTFGIVVWAARRLQAKPGWSVWISAPLVWTAVETVFPFTFPNYIGASQYPLLPLTQIADITGVLGVSFLLILGNATLFIVFESLIERRPFPWKRAAGTAIIFALTVAYGTVRIDQIDAATAAAPRLSVAVIQTGQGEAAKHKDPWQFLRLHRDLTRRAVAEARPDLIIWPESVITRPIRRETQQLPRELFGRNDRPLLLGAITADRKEDRMRKYTSAVLMDARGNKLGQYDKRILVPFGEYIPFGDVFPVLYRWLPYTSHFEPGESLAALPFGEFHLSLNICYEDLFFGLVRENMIAAVKTGRPLPHAMVNLTNDSWYGDTVEPLEHLVLASFRAIEHRRALVRATNTGISAIVDPVGRLDRRTGQWTEEVLHGDVPLLTGRTVFSYAGNWFGWMVSCLALAAIGWSFRSRT